MIHSLRVKNFLSFKEEVCLSFEASGDKHLEDYLVAKVAGKTRLTKVGIIYGANASGKSNLLKAFDFLYYFWLLTPENKETGTRVIPFLLDDSSSLLPTEFVLTLYIGEIKYVYALQLNATIVIKESLRVQTGKKPTEIFSRSTTDMVSMVTFNSFCKVGSYVQEMINVACLANMSVFAALRKLNVSIPNIDEVARWMREQFMPMIEPETGLASFANGLIINDEKSRSYINNYLGEADFNIESVQIREEGKRHQAFFSHRVLVKESQERVYELPSDLESKGTLRTMGLAGVIGKALNNNAFICIDEIESSLHPRLIEYLIERFIRESKTAQLLLTTHYDGLLEQEDLFRKDTIWFTDKKQNGSTELYSLSDFTGVNRITSLQKAYKYGKFGAIPNI